MSPKKGKDFRALRQQVYERARGACERCGYTLGEVWECHHRKKRSQGGEDTVTNLVALHMDCHNAGVPGSVHHSPGRAYSDGFLVWRRFDPREAPLHLHGERWVVLEPDGTYAPTDSPHDDEAEA